ncbi:hypothetical protein [Hyalangium minutum]|uniref:Uncharacterized protein n=1 Tax=Hyalangium minutum TaxID=394096 RepID=A0A085W3B1_9BACT|nr:hypothetical protein [Hyalangium minutum]KFE62174.1 hypothetical protein DB31_4280 [Hyalangium minutum]
MTDRLSTLQSYTTALLVALWALHPVVTVLHAQEHAHRYCPEHQTFEETVRGSGQWQSRHTQSAPVLTALRGDTGRDSLRSTHEACPLQTAGTRGEMHVAEIVCEVAECLGTSLCATAPPGSRCSVPILATAPKSSPPARA